MAGCTSTSTSSARTSSTDGTNGRDKGGAGASAGKLVVAEANAREGGKLDRGEGLELTALIALHDRDRGRRAANAVAQVVARLRRTHTRRDRRGLSRASPRSAGRVMLRRCRLFATSSERPRHA